MITSYENLFTVIGYQFKDVKLVEEAFTHNSVSKKSKNYQRLEFLGDRVLSLVISDMLYKRFPDEPEGDLAKRHTALVREETLAEVAREIDISRYLIVSDSEKTNINNPSMLADVCEALLGAMYLEAGFEKAKEFVIKYWEGRMEVYKSPPVDGKSALQEWAQGHNRPLPSYKVIETRGMEHEPEFVIEVTIKEVSELGIGIGRSKKTAEQQAATDLLRKIKKNG